MVRIRMTRIGKKNRAFYRIGAYDAHSPRNGRSIEYLGWYNPFGDKPETELKLDIQRVEHWLSVGAQPTPKIVSLLKRAGVNLTGKK